MGRRDARGVRAPWPVVGLAIFGILFLVLPVASLLIRTPWRALPSILSNSGVGQALRLSLVTSSISTVVAIVLGVPLAFVLARVRFPGAKLVRALVIVPLVLPPVVGGVALLEAFGRRGVFGQVLYSWTGVTIPFTTAAVVMAETFVAMPFLILTVEGGLRSLDRRMEDVALTLGAPRLTVMRRVTLPLIAPSLAAGAVLCWARALGEFGATVTFAGAFPGRTETMPVAVYFALETDPGAAIALSLVLLVISVGILVALRDRWLRGGVLQ